MKNMVRETFLKVPRADFRFARAKFLPKGKEFSLNISEYLLRCLFQYFVDTDIQRVYPYFRPQMEIYIVIDSNNDIIFN